MEAGEKPDLIFTMREYYSSWINKLKLLYLLGKMLCFLFRTSIFKIE